MDTTARLLLAAATGTAVTAIVRQRREARATDRRSARRGVEGTRPDDEPGSGLHGLLATWQPQRPRSLAGRVATTVWAAPLTALGVAVTALGGSLPRWRPAYATLVALDVRGPARWFLDAQSATAATLGQAVVVRAPTASHRLLVHEATHARQQERFGLLFAVVYPLASALWGYRRNPFEVAARRRALSSPVSEPSASA